MKTSLVLPSFLALAAILVGCKKSSVPTPMPTPSAEPSTPQAKASPMTPLPPQPKYEWKEFHAETFEIHSLEGKAFPIPKATRLRVEVQAKSAVFGGVISKASLAEIQHKHITLRSQNFQKMACSLMMVDESKTTCRLNKEPAAYLIRDVRAEGTAAGGVAGLYVRSKKLMEQAIQPNKVHISLSSWECIANCKTPEPQ